MRFLSDQICLCGEGSHVFLPLIFKFQAGVIDRQLYEHVFLQIWNSSKVKDIGASLWMFFSFCCFLVIYRLLV